MFFFKSPSGKRSDRECAFALRAVDQEARSGGGEGRATGPAAEVTATAERAPVPLAHLQPITKTLSAELHFTPACPERAFASEASSGMC